MSALAVEGISKHISGKQILNNISFQVKAGEIFGLIGPNGAGKTTTLRTVATLLQVESGSVSIFGYKLPGEAGEIRKIISYLPEDAGAYKNLKGREYLEFIASFFASGSRGKDLVKRGIEIAALGDRIDDRVEAYSKGMMRRLLVGRALMTNPRLAILDEPSSGLDVVNAQQIRRIIKQAASEGLSVLLSSHNMLEVELMCERIALINQGRIVAQGTPSELKESYRAENIEEVFTSLVK
ncbi:MAG: ABC transporter ATP-binding protein [Dehalococcoidales bacterium]|jgi:ABC-2 type transport system ATP-binding protein|nr:ABC transporter ATP-binding protein [Dehalococcoidales bacterium]MDD4229829.1 ABC transporter ATP-binding protein [Dehalococcoidales bacterium]MDD4465244.1 ABC transporter ATP-binding protein [Dehalococcoidales bacterium]MDD5401651.1 ABC transporter ATP-binding protein [Dehalococcoidales bacterium]NLE90780.1 ABC transporter ATP-binding protein [Dehalococcoidales bacterium]